MFSDITWNLLDNFLIVFDMIKHSVLPATMPPIFSLDPIHLPSPEMQSGGGRGKGRPGGGAEGGGRRKKMGGGGRRRRRRRGASRLRLKRERKKQLSIMIVRF